MTQYDTIGQQYALIKSMPQARFERENFEAAVGPFVKDAKVLDLACGIGYYSNHLLDWGAKYVTGVDISEAMVRGAEINLKQWIDEGKFEAMVGDGLNPQEYRRDGGKCDLVTGAWFLNYASNSEELTKMFETISTNLKDDGVFVGITPHPTNDVGAFGEQCKEMEHTMGVGVDFMHELENKEGWRTHVYAVGKGELEGQRVDFENFHLKKSVYEEAARKSGMKGGLEWRALKLPETKEEKASYDVKEEHWEFAKRVPYFGVLVLRKS